MYEWKTLSHLFVNRFTYSVNISQSMNDIMYHVLIAPINHENTAENVRKMHFMLIAHKEIPLLIHIKLSNGFLG